MKHITLKNLKKIVSSNTPDYLTVASAAAGIITFVAYSRKIAANDDVAFVITKDDLKRLRTSKEDMNLWNDNELIVISHYYK